MKNLLLRLILALIFVAAGGGGAFMVMGYKIPCEHIKMAVQCYEQL